MGLEKDIIMDLSQIQTIKDLEFILKTSHDQLDRFINTENKNLAKKIVIQKKRALGERIIYKIIDPDFRSTIKNLCQFLNEIYIPDDIASGFIQKLNTKDSAKHHLNHKNILNLDLRSFFPSITDSMIEKTLLELDCEKGVAKILSKIATIDGQLPPGYASSPILSNFVFRNVDCALINIAHVNNNHYSRYGDDLYFSSNSEIVPLEKIEKILKEHGFKINEKKIKYMDKGKSQYVSGLTVSDKNYPRIEKRTKRRLRLVLNYLNKFGLRSHLEHNKNDIDPDIFITKLKSKIDYINVIEPETAKKFYIQLKEIKQ